MWGDHASWVAAGAAVVSALATSYAALEVGAIRRARARSEASGLRGLWDEHGSSGSWWPSRPAGPFAVEEHRAAVEELFLAAAFDRGHSRPVARKFFARRWDGLLGHGQST